MIEYKVACLVCKTVHTIQLPEDDVAKYNAGMFVQVAFPYLDRGVRELLISRTCSTCFDAMWKEEDL